MGPKGPLEAQKKPPNGPNLGQFSVQQTTRQRPKKLWCEEIWIINWPNQTAEDTQAGTCALHRPTNGYFLGKSSKHSEYGSISGLIPVLPSALEHPPQCFLLLSHSESSNFSFCYRLFLFFVQQVFNVLRTASCFGKVQGWWMSFGNAREMDNSTLCLA